MKRYDMHPDMYRVEDEEGEFADYEEAIAAIEAAREEGRAEASSWVSVEERLPRKEVDVLVRGRGACTVACLVHDGWMATVGVGVMPKATITHWMPLPSAPEAIERGEHSEGEE